MRILYTHAHTYSLNYYVAIAGEVVIYVRDIALPKTITPQRSTSILRPLYLNLSLIFIRPPYGLFILIPTVMHLSLEGRKAINFCLPLGHFNSILCFSGPKNPFNSFQKVNDNF